MELHGCHSLVLEPIPVRYTPKTKSSRAYPFDMLYAMRIKAETTGLLWGVIDQWHGPSYLMINFEGVWGSAHIQIRDVEDIEAVDEAASLRLHQVVKAAKLRNSRNAV